MYSCILRPTYFIKELTLIHQPWESPGFWRGSFSHKSRIFSVNFKDFSQKGDSSCTPTPRIRPWQGLHSLTFWTFQFVLVLFKSQSNTPCKRHKLYTDPWNDDIDIDFFFQTGLRFPREIIFFFSRVWIKDCGCDTRNTLSPNLHCKFHHINNIHVPCERQQTSNPPTAVGLKLHYTISGCWSQ
jgi:hypothetical protein